MSLWLFVLFTVLLGVLITIFLFFSSRVLGFVVSKLLSTFWVGSEGFIHIGTMNISVLTGRILMGDVVYSTKDTCIRIVDCIFTFRWWIKSVRESAVVNAEKESRLSVALEGLEYLMYNNTFKYDHLEEILRKREHPGDQWAAELGLPNLVPVHQFSMPFFYRLFPATSISVKRGCMMVGNPELPTMLVVNYRKGTGLHTTDEPRFQYDYYKQVTTMELINLTVKLVSNPDYSGEEEIVVDQPINSEDFRTYAFESFKSFFKDIRFAFIDPDNDDAYLANDVPRRTKYFSGGTDKSSGSSGSTPLRQSRTLPHPPQQQHDHGKFETILQSGYVNLTYHCDVQGPVPMAADHQPFNSLTAPQWGVDIVCNAATIVYGPWANRQRESIQSFFFPKDYEDMKIHVPLAGQPRQYASFNLNITFNRDTTFRIPFRELSKDVLVAPAERKPAWLEIQMNNISTMHYIAPMVVTRASGSTVTIDAILTGCTISTSLTNTPFLTCASFAINCNMYYPLVWNQLNEWKCKLALSDPKCFFLWDHVALLNDLGADWSAGEPVQLADFVPCKYTFTLSLANFSLYCNVNEQNIIDKPNDLKENAHYAFSGPNLDCTLTLPYINFQSPKNEINFDIQTSKLALKLILPLYNSIRQHLEDTDTQVFESGEIENNAGSQFLYFDTFGVQGKYLYYSKYDPTYLDSIVLQLKGKSVTLTLFGFFVRYFLFLKSNYFGYCSRHVTREQYKVNVQKRKPTNSMGFGDEVRGQNEKAKNGFEIYVLMELEDVTALLPLHLYSARQPATITCSSARLEVRYLPIYLDLLVNFSPMTVRVPSPSKDFDSGRDPLQIRDCSFHLYFMYGPAPTVTNYSEQYCVEIREVSGHVVLSQITALTSWFSNFFFHLSNKDNSISDELTGYALPVYTTVLVRVHELGLHLWTPSYNSVTQVSLPSGFHLSSHTLISAVAHSSTTIRIPSLAIHILVPTRDVSGRSMWVETGTLQLTLVINVFNKAPHGHEDASFQWLFLRQNDEPTKRLGFLWPPTSHLKYKAYVQEALTHKDTVPLIDIPVASSSRTLESGDIHESPESRPSSSKPISIVHEDKSHGGDAVLHAPEVTPPSPLQKKKSNLLGSSLLRSSKSNLQQSGSVRGTDLAVTPFKSPSLLTVPGHDPTGATVTDTDFSESEVDNENYYSAESSIASDGEDEAGGGDNMGGAPVNGNEDDDNDDDMDDDDDDDDDFNTDNDDIYSSVKDFPTFLGKQRIQTELRKSAESLRKSAESGDSSGDPEPGNSKDPFERAKKANMFGNELDPEIHSLHHYLKHFIISRGGAKVEQVPSATATSEKVTFTEYQPYQGVRVTLPGCARGDRAPACDPQPVPAESASKGSESPHRHEGDDEHVDDAATTIISLDTVNDIEIFATPVVVSIVEELIECLIAKSPSVDNLLDNFQLKTISEKFTVRKYLHNRSMLELTARNVHFRFIQAAQSVPNNRIYMSEITLERVQVQLAVCHRRRHDQAEGVPPMTPVRPGSLHASPSFAPGGAVRGGIAGYQLPEEELCSFECSLSLGRVHACSQLLNNQSDTYPQVPPSALLTPHEPGSHVLLSFNTDYISIEGAYNDTRAEGQKSSFLAHIAPIHVNLILDSPLIIFQIAEGWVLHIKDLLRVVSNYQELWARQLQCLVCEILRANAKPLAQRLHTKADDPNYRGILDPSFTEIIGEHAILHRSGWQEISRMRHYMKAVGSQAYLDAMLKQTMAKNNNNQENYSSFEAFQQLINDVYESDQRENMLDLFQSSLIKKVFIEPPGKNSNVKIDVKFVSNSVTISFFGASPVVENKCLIGKANLAGTVGYQYSTTPFSPSQATASAHRTNNAPMMAPDRMALAARHPVARVAIDASVSMDCESLSLELAPSILVLGRSLTTILEPSDASSAIPIRPPLASPVTWQTSLPPSKSADLRNSNHAMAEWKMLSTPELGKMRPSKSRALERSGGTSGGSDKVPMYDSRSKDRVNRKMHFTIMATASVDEISLKGSSQKNGGAQVVIQNTCFILQKMDPAATHHYLQQLEHSALLRLSTVSLFFFNPAARAKEEQTLGKIKITDLVLHEVTCKGPNSNKRVIRTFSNTSSSSSSSSSSSQAPKREWESHRGLPGETIHDVLLHFSSAKLPFNTYDKMLPKLLGFLDEWNPVDLIPSRSSQLTTNAVVKEKEEGLIPSSLMGLRVKLDLQNVTLDTDVLHSLPFKYTIQRFTASITPNSSGVTDALISKEIAFDLRIWGHELQVDKVSGSTPSFLSSKLVFPQITSHGTISELSPRPGTPRSIGPSIPCHNLDLTCGLEIDVIKHTIDVDMLNTLMVLQKTIETELKQTAKTFSGYAKKRKDKQPKQPGTPKSPSSSTLPNIKITYLLDLALRGIEIRALSPKSILLLSSDLIDCKLKGSYLFTTTMSTPLSRIPSGSGSGLAFEANVAPVPSPLSINWQVRLRKLAMCLTDAPGQVWASIVTNIDIRTTPEGLESSPSFESIIKAGSSSIPAKRTIPWFGVAVQSTSITLHAGAIECAAGLFVHYLDSFEKGKNTIKDALGPASPKAQPDELSFLIKVVDTSLSVPLAFAPSDNSNSNNTNNTNNNTNNNNSNTNNNNSNTSTNNNNTNINNNHTNDPNLIASLESFVLSGEVTNVKKVSTTSTPQRLLGSSHFSALQVRFCDGYSPLSKASATNTREAYSENWAMISQGTCAIAGTIDGPSVVMAGELVTSGMQANITNELLKYSNLLTSFLALSQEKLKNLNSTVPQPLSPPVPVAPSTPTPRTLELDFSFYIQTGSCRLSRAWTHGNIPLLHLDRVAVPPTPTAASKPPTPLAGSGSTGSPFLSPPPSRTPLPSHESFPLPPLVLSIHHTFTLAEGKGTEDSSVGITIDSAKLRFTPFLAIFLEEMMYCSTLFPAPVYVPSSAPSTPTTPTQPPPAQPTSSGQGSVTVAIKFNPTTLILEGGGITEIVCTLELGSVEFFLSSLHKAVPPHGNTVLLHNAVANIHSLALKIHHPMSADENAGLFVSNIGFNIGQAYGLRVDNGRVVCALLDGQICSAYFNMRHLDDFLVFVWTWTRASNQHPKAPSFPKEPIPSPPLPPPTPPLASPKDPRLPSERISFFINARVSNLMVDVDLTPLSRISLHVDSVVAGFCPGSGSMEDSSRIGSFVLTFLTGPAEVSFNGKLDGVAKIGSAALMGERRALGEQRASRKKRSQPAQAPAPSSKVVSMWAAQLSSPHVSLEYNLAHILLLKAGDFFVKIIDHVYVTQTTEAPNIDGGKKPALTEPNLTEAGTLALKDLKGPYSCELISQKLHLQISCETITSIIDIVRLVTVNVKEKLAVANSVFETVNGEEISVVPAVKATMPEKLKDNEISPPLPPPSRPILVIGQVVVKGFNIKVWFFGYSIRDPAWANFTLESYQITLDKQIKRTVEIHRQLSIVLGQNHVSKMVENELAESHDPWHRPATETKIFRIPVASLIMYTMQPITSKEVEFYFLTEFTDSIWVSLNIGLYGYLREIATLYSRAAEDEGKEQASSFTALPAAAIQNSTPNLPTVPHKPPARSGSIIIPPYSHRRPSSNDPRVFVEKTFQLSPTLNVLGDFTPKITTVFGWLGIKDINHTIPYYTHLGLTDNLEEILSGLHTLYGLQK